MHLPFQEMPCQTTFKPKELNADAESLNLKPKGAAKAKAKVKAKAKHWPSYQPLIVELIVCCC